ncbi:hypothetical protein ACQKLX_27680, partial [Bosea sp. NPDC003192]|uniref:hypothetical protein n=1 Tax=Bosea sp. NPDC003192 TaxID=3390551 RepID=UPI003D0011D3
MKRPTGAGLDAVNEHGPYIRGSMPASRAGINLGLVPAKALVRSPSLWERIAAVCGRGPGCLACLPARRARKAVKRLKIGSRIKKRTAVEKLSSGVLTGEAGSPYKAAIETAPPLAGPL